MVIPYGYNDILYIIVFPTCVKNREKNGGQSLGIHSAYCNFAPTFIHNVKLSADITQRTLNTRLSCLLTLTNHAERRMP